MPEGYEQPKSDSKYFNPSKVVNGVDNIIRILSKPIMGWLDWKTNSEGKQVPVRIPYNQPKPAPNDPEKPVKHFWAMVIWDYKDEAIKIMEITQSSIQDAIYTLDYDSAWGDPTQYDLNIKKEGEKLTTKYTVTPRPPKPLEMRIEAALREANPNLNELYKNGDPFASKGDNATGAFADTEQPFTNEEPIDGPTPDEEVIDISKIPF